MAERTFDSMRVFWATGTDGIATFNDDTDGTEVTESEITAAVPLSAQLTADGVQFNPTNNNASLEKLLGGKTSQRPGTRSFAGQLQASRDDSDDTFWDTFSYGEEGYLLVFPFGTEVGSDVYVFFGATHEPVPINSAANTYQQSVLDFPSDDWDLRGTVVADPA